MSRFYTFILSLLCSVCVFSQTRIGADNIFNYYLMEAVKAKYHNDFNDALSLYMNCYKLDNQSSTVMYEISRIYYAAKKMDEANLWLDRAIELDSTKNLEYIKYGATLKLYSGKYSQAKEFYKILADKESDIPTHKLMLARLYSQLNQADSAHMTLNQISTELVPWSSIQLEHAELYTHELNPRKLKKTISGILKKEPNEASSYKYMADYYFAVKDTKNGLKYLNEGLSKNNGDVLLLDLSDYYYKIESYSLFKSYLDKVATSVDIEADTKRVKLASYLQQKDKEKYLREESDYFTKILKETVSFHPDDEGLNMLLATYYNFTSRQSESMSLMDRFFANHSASYDFYALYISSIMSQPVIDWEKFDNISKSAYDLYDDQPYMVQARVIALNHFDRYKQSIDILSEFLAELTDVQGNQQLRAIKIDFLNLLAESYYSNGQLEDSFATYDAVLSLDPNNISALNNYAYYLSLVDRNLDKAESMSAKTITVEPNNPTYLDTYAWVLYKREKYSMAQLMIEAALNNSSEVNPELVEHYGFILRALGNIEESVIQFKKALEIDSKREYLKEFIVND